MKLRFIRQPPWRCVACESHLATWAMYSLGSSLGCVSICSICFILSQLEPDPIALSVWLPVGKQTTHLHLSRNWVLCFALAASCSYAIRSSFISKSHISLLFIINVRVCVLQIHTLADMIMSVCHETSYAQSYHLKALLIKVINFGKGSDKRKLEHHSYFTWTTVPLTRTC